MAKPTKIPRWASASALIVEPTSGKKTAGFGVERPPCEHFNWLHNLAYQWIGFLGDPTLSFSALAGRGGNGITTDWAAVDGMMTDGSAGGESFFLPLTLPVGQIIDQIQISLLGDAVFSVDIDLFVTNHLGVSSTPAFSTANFTPGVSMGQHTIAISPAYTIPTNASFALVLQPGDGGMVIGPTLVRCKATAE